MFAAIVMATAPVGTMGGWTFAIELLFVVIWLWPLYVLAISLRKLARIMSGRCTDCDYLLRGLTMARCPECGKPFVVVQGLPE